MDANGARFWVLAGPTAADVAADPEKADLVPADDPAQVAWDSRRALVLSSQRPTPPLDADATAATAARKLVRLAIDGSGSIARHSKVGSNHFVRVTREGFAEAEIFKGKHSDGVVSDVLFGEDGIVTVVHGGVLVLRDSRTFGDEREDWHRIDTEALAPGTGPFEAWRVASAPGGGAWVLDPDNGKLAKWTGFLLRKRPRPDVAPGTFRPDPEDPTTLQFVVPHRTGFGSDDAVAIACSPEGQVAVLGIRSGDDARVYLFDAEGKLARTAALEGVEQPISLAWVGEDRLAVLVTLGAWGTALQEALVYGIPAPPVDPGEETFRLTGEIYPLREPSGEAFVQTPDRSAQYPTAEGPKRLVPLSLPHRARSGTATGRYIDSARADTCWHRLNIEARIPAGCGIRVELGTARTHLPDDVDEWYPHDFGTVPGSDRRVPKGAWTPGPSEIPGSKGLLHCQPELERAGTFTALIQRSTKRTTRLVGRFLHVRVTLHGSGMTTPELAAIRAWAPRFSYVRQYLPQLYHEDPQVDGSDEPGASTNADFLERFVSNFEGVLTPLEDKVAEAWHLTNPRTAPPHALDWLAGWVGRALDPALAVDARRRFLGVMPELARWRGTLHGLKLALEAATGGGVTRGDLIVLEEWRLRRTWATILGADLADEEDPLLGGLAISGNSLVGDTLILGDESEREFLALFGEDVIGKATTAAEAIENARDRLAIQEFFESTAHRITVLVFSESDDEQFGLITRVAESETPAHVSIKVRRASRSFIAGITALVGVDTRLNVEPAPLTVRLGTTRLGEGDRVRRPPSLHPDLEGDGS